MTAIGCRVGPCLSHCYGFRRVSVPRSPPLAVSVAGGMRGTCHGEAGTELGEPAGPGLAPVAPVPELPDSPVLLVGVRFSAKVILPFIELIDSWTDRQEDSDDKECSAGRGGDDGVFDGLVALRDQFDDVDQGG